AACCKYRHVDESEGSRGRVEGTGTKARRHQTHLPGLGRGLMSTYIPDWMIHSDELFTRLSKYGVHNLYHPGERYRRRLLLQSRWSRLWVNLDAHGFMTSFERYGRGNPYRFLQLISDELGLVIMPQGNLLLPSLEQTFTPRRSKAWRQR